MDSGVHRNDRMDVFYKGVNIDCYGAQGTPRNGCNGKKCVLLFMVLDKKTSQKMPCVLVAKVLDDHDIEFS